MKKISIIIPVYNGEKFVANCLRAVYDSEIPVPYETIVIDDGSTDRTAEIVKKFSCKYFRMENSGVAAARNKGIREADGDILFFFDADITFKKDTIKKFLKHFADDPDACVIQAWYGETPVQTFWALFLTLRYTFNLESILKGGRRVPVANLETGSLAIRKEVFDEFTGFDTSYRSAGGEEHELGLRLMQKYKLYYYSDLMVQHSYGGIKSTLTKIVWRTVNFAILSFNAKEKKDFMSHHELCVPWRDKISIIILFLMISNVGMLFYDPQFAVIGFVTLFLGYVVNVRQFLAFLKSRKDSIFAARAVFADIMIMLPRLIGVVIAVFIFYVLRAKEFKI